VWGLPGCFRSGKCFGAAGVDEGCNHSSQTQAKARYAPIDWQREASAGKEWHFIAVPGHLADRLHCPKVSRPTKGANGACLLGLTGEYWAAELAARMNYGLMPAYGGLGAKSPVEGWVRSTKVLYMDSISPAKR
jgi:hypothetical protein